MPRGVRVLCGVPLARCLLLRQTACTLPFSSCALKRQVPTAPHHQLCGVRTTRHVSNLFSLSRSLSLSLSLSLAFIGWSPVWVQALRASCFCRQACAVPVAQRPCDCHWPQPEPVARMQPEVSIWRAQGQHRVSMGSAWGQQGHGYLERSTRTRGARMQPAAPRDDTRSTPSSRDLLVGEQSTAW